MTRAIGRTPASASGAVPAWASAPVSAIPFARAQRTASWDATRVQTGRRNALPADARRARGENGHAQPGVRSAAAAPNASPLRRIAPTFAGSWTSSRTCLLYTSDAADDL